MFSRIRRLLGLKKPVRVKNPQYQQRGQALGSGPDKYPGDEDFTEILQHIYHGPLGMAGVSHDKISLEFKANSLSNNGLWTRSEIVAELLQRYAGVSAAGATCKAFLGNANITQADCVNALTYPKGYQSAAGWQAWAGLHDGCWYQDGEPGLPDDARWRAPYKEPANSLYDHQPVDFLKQGGGIARHGWNQSHPAVAYVWGWDPKDNGQEDGLIGAHLGFQFQSGGAEAIIWFTTKEAFLEAVRTVSGVRRRISVGLYGVGQWTIKP
jgi:hypothetical protein